MWAWRFNFLMAATSIVLAGSFSFRLAAAPNVEEAARAGNNPAAQLDTWAAEQKRRVEQAGNIKHWESLKLGMSFKEVDGLVGPFHPKARGFVESGTVAELGVRMILMEPITTPGEQVLIYKMVLDGSGKLRSWQLGSIVAGTMGYTWIGVDKTNAAALNGNLLNVRVVWRSDIQSASSVQSLGVAHITVGDAINSNRVVQAQFHGQTSPLVTGSGGSHQVLY